jgi:hypothetical protein
MKWKQRIAVALITAMIAGEASPPMMTMADTGNGSEAASNQIVLANANTKQAAPVFIAKNSAAASAIAHAADGYAGDIELVTGVKPAVSQIASFTGETEQQEVNYALASNEGTITLEAARKGEGELSVLLDGQYPSKKDNSGRWRYSIGTKNTANEENAFKLTIKLKEKIKLTHVDIVGQQNYNKQAEHVDTVDINSTVISYATAPVIIQYKVDDDWLSGTQMTGNANIWNRWTPDANASIITDEVRLVYDGSQVADGYVRFSEIEVWGTPVTDSSETEVPSADTAIIAGTLADDDTLIQSLIKNNKLDTKQLDEIRGGWERYNIQVVDNPTDTIKKAVVVVGSDRRGAVYGLYHISQDLCGVSPWTYWGDVVTQQMDELAFSAGDLQTTSDTPSVKYRGIFLNDEAPSLTSWVEKFGGYNEDFYDHVYELILRLKGNYLWPAMWANVFSTDGKSDPLANAEHADAYGVVMGTSHHEPLFRAGEEWTREKKNYLEAAGITYTDAQNNSDKYWDFTKWGNAIKLFWQDGVKRNKAFDNIITLGMRGEADSALEGTTEQNIANLVNVIEAQNEILKEENAYDQPQVLTLYKEVEEYWHKGLKEKLKGVLKQDATIMLCEDNHGNLSTLPTTDDRSYFNNWGMYYHFDYHGGPRSYEWIDTVPLTKVWNNMTMAYDYGVQNIWIVNVGDLKPMELPISYFLDMAYDFDQWGTGNPNSTQTYTEQWVNQQFGNSGLGEEELKDVAQILSDYTRINSRHKPEIVAYDTYSLTNYNEAQRVLDEAIKLEERATAYLEKLRELDSYNGTKYADSYYQLVYYPAAATANVNQMEIFSGLNIRYANWRSVAANTYAELVKVCIQKDKDLQDYYNNTMSDGKWKGMMSSLHVGYTQWDSSNSAYPTAKYVTPVEGSKMIVDVDGSDTCAEKTGDLTLPDFTSTGKEAYAVTISNGGNQTLEYEVKRSADWIQVETGAGSLQTARTLTVSVDWANEELTQKLAADKKASGTIEITSDGKTVRITVNAVSSNVDTQEENVFTASNGAIAIEANHFASKDDRWYELENYGKTGSSMKVYPTTSSFASGEGPSLTYKVYAETEGD